MHDGPLFESPPGEFYNYAPCLVQTDADTRDVFYCSNLESGKIVDYVTHRRARRVDGVWRWGPPHVAIGPGPDAGDCIHVCDPDVLRGELRCWGHTCTWALFYLGCDRHNCNHNQIGVALADDLQRRWIKFEGNPLIPGDENHWGTGQSSSVSWDDRGRLELVYRLSDARGTRWGRAECDLSDLDHPLVCPTMTRSEAGLRGGGAHVAYDRRLDRYYLAAESGWDPQVRCLQVTEVAWIAGDEFRAGRGEWRVLATLDHSVTGLYGNHNPPSPAIPGAASIPASPWALRFLRPVRPSSGPSASTRSG